MSSSLEALARVHLHRRPTTETRFGILEAPGHQSTRMTLTYFLETDNHHCGYCLKPVLYVI